MHEVLVNRLGGLSLPRKSVVRLTDRPDMTLDVYRGRKTTMQHDTPCNPTNEVLLGRRDLQLNKTLSYDDVTSEMATCDEKGTLEKSDGKIMVLYATVWT